MTSYGVVVVNERLNQATYVRDLETKRGIKIQGSDDGKSLMVSYLVVDKVISGPCRLVHDADLPVFYIAPYVAAHHCHHEFVPWIAETVADCLKQNGMAAFLEETDPLQGLHGYAAEQETKTETVVQS